jgi:hypothetical protein
MSNGFSAGNARVRLIWTAVRKNVLSRFTKTSSSFFSLSR